jgi:hypothetical protein
VRDGVQKFGQGLVKKYKGPVKGWDFLPGIDPEVALEGGDAAGDKHKGEVDSGQTLSASICCRRARTLFS